MWGVVTGRYFLIGDVPPSDLSAPCICRGYIDIDKNCQLREKSVSAKRFSFQIRNGDICMTLSVLSKSDRDNWVEILNLAMSGEIGDMPDARLKLPDECSYLVGTISANAFNSLKSDPHGSHEGAKRANQYSSTAMVNYPSKSGFLLKTSSSAAVRFAIGKNAVNRRFFVLEKGQLQYFDDENTTTSRLKGAFELTDASVGSGSISSSTSAIITVQLASSGSGSTAGSRVLELEAGSVREAAEWRAALSDTVVILAKFPPAVRRDSDTTCTPAAVLRYRRRSNIHDRISDETAASLIHSSSRESFAQSALRLATSPPAASGSSKSRGFSFSWTGGSTAADGDESSAKKGSVPVKANVNSFSPPSSKLSGERENQLASPSKMLPSTLELVSGLLQSHFLLRARPEFDVSNLITFLQHCVNASGDVVFWQGSTGDAFYMVESGTCEVSKSVLFVYDVAVVVTANMLRY